MKRIIGLALAAISLSASGQDWSQWRGAERDGKVSGLIAPKEWPEKLTKVWEASIGRGDSSSVVSDGKVYAFGRIGGDEVLTCLELETGKLVWQSKYAESFAPAGPQAGHPGPRSSPLVANGKVYTLGVGGVLSCFDVADGKVVWQKKSKADYGDLDYKFDTGLSPMIADGKLIVGIGDNAGKKSGAMLAIDAATGEIKWKCVGEAPFYDSPMLMTVDGEKLIVMFTENSLNLITLSEGKIVWKKTFNKFTHVTPMIDGSTIYYAGPDFPLSAIKIAKKDGAYDATELWTSTLKTRFSSPVMSGGKIYGFFGNGVITCVNAEDGKTAWADTTNRGQYASLIDAKMAIFVLTVKGDLIVVKLGGEKYEEIAKYKVSDNELWAHPIISGKRVLIRDKDAEICWELK